MKRANSTDRAPKAIGPYSQSITQLSGRTVYISGQLPIDPSTSSMPEGIAAQTEQAIRNIESILAGVGGKLADVLKVTVYLQDIGEFGAMNEVYARLFPAPFPARAAFEVAALPRGARVEIEAVASIDGDL